MKVEGARRWGGCGAVSPGLQRDNCGCHFTGRGSGQQSSTTNTSRPAQSHSLHSHYHRSIDKMVANGKEVDHFTDDDESDLEIDYTDIEERFRPKFQDTFDNLIVVEGAPVVDESKRVD
ncbi:hypothetical protein H4Q26_008870 [Puccinia striiformis f. sp. tritici PST-130]|nr:hypothetical protein H4Q26_008870 [Puccinia striiformis f. sp. tritici PST-130]